MKCEPTSCQISQLIDALALMQARALLRSILRSTGVGASVRGEVRFGLQDCQVMDLSPQAAFASVPPKRGARRRVRSIGSMCHRTQHVTTQ